MPKKIRLSHSSRLLLRGCERKYFLTKMKQIDSIYDDYDIIPDSNTNNANLDFGTAFGIGIARLLATNGDVEAAIWTAVTSFNFADETRIKNVLSLVAAIRAFDAQWEYDLWEVAVLANGKPAAELSFKLVLNRETGDYTCGFMDIILRNRETGFYTVLECKTTGIKIEDVRPLYQNSDQGVGYSLILDSIVGEQSTYHVLYVVLQLKHGNILPTFHFLPFIKTRKDRLEFLFGQQLDYEYLQKMIKLDFWPTRGSHCLSWGRPCHFFGLCSLESLLEKEESEDVPENDWDFVYYLDDLLEAL